MKKKVVSMLVIMAIALGLLAGCGSSKETSQSKSSESSSASTENAKEESTIESQEPEEPVHLKWYVYGSKANAEPYAEIIEAVNKLLLEKINVTVEIIGVKGSELSQRVDLALSANEEFDLVWVSDWTNDYAQLVEKEGLIPLDQLLEDYGKDILETVKEQYLEMCKINGTLYAVPCLQTMNEQYSFIVQKKYADEYGLDLDHVETIAELEPFLDWIVENYPDLYALNDPAGYTYFKSQYESLGAGCYIKKDDPFNVVWEPYRSFNNEYDYAYVQKGYYQKDIATVVDKSGDMAANKYVVTVWKNKPSITEELSAKYGVKFINIPVGEPYLTSTASRATAVGISATSKHPEAAMKLLNAFFTDEEIYNTWLYGIEGKHYNKVGDNRVELIEDGGWNLTAYQWVFGNQFNAWLYGDLDDNVWIETEKMNDESVVSPLLGFTFDTSELSAEIAQISAVNDEFANSFWLENHDDFYEQWKTKMIAAGIEKCVAEAQRQLDEWRAANNK